MTDYRALAARLNPDIPLEAKAAAALTEAADTIERLEKDAARYRWIRDASTPERAKFYLATDTRNAFIPCEIDTAIDAAMKGQP